MSIFGRRSRHRLHRGVNPFAIGLIAVVLVVMGSYFAYTRANPFSDPYELQAVFETANNLKSKSPVRIAGVEVGVVTAVESVGGDGETPAARVTMEIEDKGLPIHEDAELKVRPRIFLEGNFFVDLEPGSPSAPEAEDGHVIPSNQTASPVQFNELLAVLQSDVRADLQTFLQEYSEGLEGEGAEAFNASIEYWESAYRNSSLANEATLGTEEGDLSRLVRGQQETFRALARNEQALKDLITDFNVTAAAFAREDEALEATIPELRDVLEVGMPALASLNDTLPGVRAFARDALPGTRSSGPTIDASMPFVRQARRLVSEEELKGLVDDLRPTVPALARLNRDSIPLFEQQRLLSSCTNEVLLPFATTPIPHPDLPAIDGMPFYQTGPRGLVGLAGESRLHDGNSPIQRAAFTVGAQEIAVTSDEGQRLFGTSLFPMLGARPVRPNRRPDARPDVPCETQEPPNMNAVSGQVEQNVEPQPQVTAASRERRAEVADALDKLTRHVRDAARGLPTIDPLRFSDLGLELQAEELGLEPLANGGYRVLEDLEELGG
ncbi:MAG: MlaD family protein [Thermoleophilaceae bacterium]